MEFLAPMFNWIIEECGCNLLHNLKYGGARVTFDVSDGPGMTELRVYGIPHFQYR
jgi:hypothetical protein